MFLSSLEFALNKYLALDPETQACLSQLENKVIFLEISDWRIRFFIIVHKNNLELLANHPGPVTTSIRSQLFDLINVACARGETSALFHNKVEISGDIATGEALQKILANIDIDWEEQLSKVVGDVGAHHIGKALRGLREFARNSLDNVAEQLKSFLQVEQNQLPSKAEMERFVANVTQLQQDAERLEARINELSFLRKQESIHEKKDPRFPGDDGI